MPLYFVLDGHEPVPVDDVMTWARWFEANTAARIVGKTRVGDQEVSTVFLGLDHQYGSGPPLLFETMVFPECDDCQRYSTWDQAVAGHDATVGRLRRELLTKDQG